MAGITTFHDSSSAGNGTLLNQDGPNASAGQFVFDDSSTAGQGTFTNQAKGGLVIFNDNFDRRAGQHRPAGEGELPCAILGRFQRRRRPHRHRSLNPRADQRIQRRAILSKTPLPANSTITVRGDGGERVASSAIRRRAMRPSSPWAAPGLVISAARSQATVIFDSFSTAGNATIIAEASTVAGAPGGLIQIHNGGHAGAATLIANGGATAVNGGLIRFGSAGTGDSARLVVNAGAASGLQPQRFHAVRPSDRSKAPADFRSAPRC